MPPGHLTDLPFYRSVWTSLHAMAWGDMSFFSDPSRHGFFRQPYPRKRISPPRDLRALAGTRAERPGAVRIAVIGAGGCTGRCWSPVCWHGRPTSPGSSRRNWALKTKYLLFLLPPYLLYALVGLRWISRRATVAGHAVVGLLVGTVILTNLYLLEFAAR